MRKIFLTFILFFVVAGLCFTGCEEGGLSDSTSDSSETQVYQEWNQDVNFKLLIGSSTEADVVINCKIYDDGETNRKEAAYYTNVEEAEAAFEGQEVRWIKCIANVSVPENAAYAVSDIAFMCYLGRYPDTSFGTEYCGRESSASTTGVAIIYTQSQDLRVCKATIYACIPADDDSYMIVIQKCIGGSHDIPRPELPDNSVLCWAIS